MKHKFLYKIKEENGQIVGDWYVIDARWLKMGFYYMEALKGYTYDSTEQAVEIIANMKKWFRDNYEFEALVGSLVRV